LAREVITTFSGPENFEKTKNAFLSPYMCSDAFEKIVFEFLAKF
jgi:hypothetical protein